MIPITTQPLVAFLGEDQSKSSVLLPDLYSPGGSENLYIDKFGRIRTIEGFSKQTASALTTSTGGSVAKVVALFPYRKTASGTFTRHIMVVIDDANDEWELWYSTDDGATFTFIADLGSSSVGKIPSFVQFGDELYIVNGVITARMWNGTTLTVAGATQLGAPTVTNANAGSLSGNFYYKLVPIKTDGTRKAGSDSSAVAQISDKQNVVSWTADTDVTVAGYEIYRTSGSGLVFFFIDYSQGRTSPTSYTDNLPDSELIGRRILIEHGDAPPTGVYLVTQHKGRVCYGRTDTYPRRVWLSDPGDADSVYVDENYIDCTEGEDMGDVLTGLRGDHEGMLVATLERAIFTISGTGELIGDRLDWRKRRTNARQGSVSHRAIVKVPKGARFFDEKGSEHETAEETLAYFTPIGDIRLFSRNADTIISHGIKDRISSFAYAQRGKIWVLQDTALNHIVWFYPASGKTECTAAVAWNHQLGTWHYWSSQTLGHGIETETSTAAQLILVGDNRTGTGAFVYEYKDGTTFDTATYTATLMTKPLWAKDRNGQSMFSRMIRERYLDLIFDRDHSPDNVTVMWLPYDAADDDDPEGAVAVAGSSRVHAQIRDSHGQHFHSFAPRFRITTTGGRGWILTAGERGYQVLAGRKRVA